MARLARPILSLILVMVVCVEIGSHSGTPPTSVSVVVASVHTPRDPFIAPPPTTTSATVPAPPHVVLIRASRGERRPLVPGGLPDQRRPLTPDERLEAETVICSYDWPCQQAVRVAGCESGLKWWRINGRARGIFQILGGPLDLKLGVALAHSMWEKRGWGPWRASRSCSGVG